ncbi:TPA: hypothetical protein QDZ75_003679 [Stenotrophomonas maltophilia]|nr:hypothetical protein [Stenotrophomonas maltophilia]
MINQLSLDGLIGIRLPDAIYQQGTDRVLMDLDSDDPEVCTNRIHFLSDDVASPRRDRYCSEALSTIELHHRCLDKSMTLQIKHLACEALLIGQVKQFPFEQFPAGILQAAKDLHLQLRPFVHVSPSLRALAVRVVTAAYRKEGDSLHP